MAFRELMPSMAFREIPSTLRNSNDFDYSPRPNRASRRIASTPCMPAARLIAIFSLLLLLPGCATYDAMMPHLRKPFSWSDNSRQAQQEAYDRQISRSSGGTRNRTRSAWLGSSNYIPGASANPFAP
jgi:hypothetical protein